MTPDTKFPLEVQRELTEARQELRSVQTRVAKLQRDCASVHILEVTYKITYNAFSGRLFGYMVVQQNK